MNLRLPSVRQIACLQHFSNLDPEGGSSTSFLPNVGNTAYCSGCEHWSSQNLKLSKSNPITGLDRSWGFQEVEAPRFQDNRHVKVVKLSALGTGRLYPQEIFLVLISVKGWADPRVTARPEGICQWNIPMTPTGIEPATYGLVAQRLKLKASRYSNQLYACGTLSAPKTVRRMTWCRINTYKTPDVSERRTVSIHRVRRSPETSWSFYDTTQHQSSVSALRNPFVTWW